jgi:aminoglycoside phosphotransferase (APT) family kinase protein
MRTTSLGPPIAHGATAEIYAWGDGKILKLFKEHTSRSTVEYEAHITNAVHAAGLPIPAMHSIVEIGERYGLVYDRVKGLLMVDLLKTKPWALLRLAEQLADLQVEIHKHTVPDLPSLRERLLRKIETKGRLTASLKKTALAALDKLPDGDQLCHGDFHPLNVMITAGGPVIIDWNDATCGHPSGDVARTALLLSSGEVPPGTPFGRLFKLFQGRFYRRYTKRYSQLQPSIWQTVPPWLPVVAAARLSDNIPDPQGKMMAIIRQGFGTEGV